MLKNTVRWLWSFTGPVRHAPAFLFVGFAVMMPATAVHAEDNAKTTRLPQQKASLSFLPVGELSYSLASPSLIGARPADPKDFTASFYAMSVSGACTSTLIGNGVLLTAAHCVPDKGTISLTAAGKTHQGTCTHAPGYAGNLTEDWALCAFPGGGPAALYERLNVDPESLRVGDQVQLSGFGCVKVNGGGGNDGIYRIGEAPVVSLPKAQDNDIVTTGEAALCFGDSGGPAFRYVDSAFRSRRQVGVNSRGNIRDTSYLSSVSTAAAKKFISEWSAANPGLRICGVHADATGCRP
jgi:hypothetical protein